MNEAQATPHAELIADLMNPNNPKNEREHAAVREIERLSEDRHGVDAVDTLTEEGWLWDGDQWQRPALQSAWLLESTQTLAKTLAREFYPEVTQWECLNDLAGVISQIDNMTTGLMRKPKQEPTGCACQWSFEGDRVVTCARHEGWLEVIVEWADRARDAEKKLKALAQPVPQAIIAGALFDFMGWLTSRPKRIMLSSADEASPAVDAIKEFAKMRGLSLDDARVQDWQDNTTPPASQPEQEQNFCSRCGKRTPDLATIHTCTPPAVQPEQEPVASEYIGWPVAYQYAYPDGTWQFSFGDEINGCKPIASRAVYARKDGK